MQQLLPRHPEPPLRPQGAEQQQNYLNFYGNLMTLLMSDGADYITGETIVADGGRMGLNYTVPVVE